MLKVIRKGAIENPWFFRTIMGLIAAAFIISMGWWGFKNQENVDIYAAKVDDEVIPIMEYERTYQSTYKAYKEIFKENIKDISEDTIKKLVIDNLIDQRLWLKDAQRMSLKVGREELTDLVTSIPAFQKDGKFDVGLYRRVLAQNHLTPETFEKMQIETILIEKAKNIVRESTVLTEGDQKDVAAILKEGPMAAGGAPAIEERTKEHILQKRMRALMAYTDALRKNAKIEIKNGAL
ncbi:MAG TPA: SurA N-terminal domain-containing protein [Nitrospiria bacterium]|nr:SurA N-terminal domain-containing protein [Nitrospiria bacterium]